MSSDPLSKGRSSEPAPARKKGLQTTPQTDSDSLQIPKQPDSATAIEIENGCESEKTPVDAETVPKKTRSTVDDLNRKEALGPNAKNEPARGSSRRAEKTRFTKGTWKPDEDKQLISLVSSFGPQNWTRIAEFIPHRSGKQCRERWHNHLNPNINKQKWSLEEDRILIEAHKK